LQPQGGVRPDLDLPAMQGAAHGAGRHLQPRRLIGRVAVAADGAQRVVQRAVALEGEGIHLQHHRIAGLAGEIADGAPQAFLQPDPRPPSQQVLRAADVRATLHRVVLGQRAMQEPGRAAGLALHRLGQFGDGIFLGFAEIHRPGDAAFRPHQADHALHQVIDVAEKDLVWRPSPYSVIGWPRSACTMKLDTARPSFGCMRGP
jgi:hypothetical protein